MTFHHCFGSLSQLRYINHWRRDILETNIMKTEKYSIGYSNIHDITHNNFLL